MPRSGMKSKQNITAAFTEMAHRYEQTVDQELKTIWGWSYDAFVAAVVKEIPLSDGDRILDIATGTAVIPLALASAGRLGLKISGLDITPAMLVAAEAHLTGKGVTNVTFRQVAAEAMPFDDASFDLVTCRIAPHHFEGAARFVQEAARVLKPGGMLLVQDHLMPEDATAARYIEAFEKLRDPSHNRAFAETEWRAMFADAGLTVTHVEQLDKVLDFATYADRQGVTPSTRACLIVLMQQAPPEVLAWMQPTAWDTPEACYNCRHVILRGSKAS